MNVSAWWLSIGLGGGIGVLYILASWAVTRFAARFESRRFMLIVISGMMARLAVALVLVILVLVLMPVEARWFIGAFLAAFALGLAGEVYAMHRRPLPASDPPASNVPD